MLVPWAVGFVTYQLINPGYISWWVSAWTWAGRQIGFTPASWMSASLCSFLVAAAATLLVGWPTAPCGVVTGAPGSTSRRQRESSAIDAGHRAGAMGSARESAIEGPLAAP